MGKVELNVPRMKRVAGRWYWRTTPTVKALGFCDEPLGDDTEKAIARARDLNAQVEAERTRRAGLEPSIIPGSVAELIGKYEASPQFAKLAPKTKQDYRLLLRRIEKVAGSKLVSSITRAWLVQGYEVVQGKSGLATANAVMRVWRILLGHACDRGMIDFSPADGMRLIGTAARTQVWTRDQVETFCAAAEKHGRPSLALAVRLALDIGQRQGDILALKWSDYDGTAFAIVQGKTKQPVRVPVTAQMQKLLSTVKRDAVQVIVSEATGRPYAKFHFVHEFSRVRALAGLPTDLQFRDLRRTAATELGAAGATDDEIRSVTGHRSRGVVAVYVQPDGRMAESAQKKRQRLSKPKR
ncbi:phage integrase family protein [Azospirillum brasilense]|uniref:Phage integrase family protein n=2 Tax=Azospirillum baldaniorum TaxID=1064539 RepID=A0A9P1NL93_9PROT|nr:phage integrase family protein [Azospirillum baldaniorum]TWA79117.1 phage integrase family protein [Azospirillum brasilense]CCC96864.1 putative phage integrase family protein [Azospirillum baldaniorum]